MLLPLLDELGGRSLRARLPFLGVLDRVLSHPDPALRASAIAVFAGAQGIPAWRALVAALKDPDASVRLATVRPLHTSATTDPARWIHAVFHPDPEVRRLARNIGAPYGFKSLFPPDAPYTDEETYAADIHTDPPETWLPPEDVEPIWRMLQATTCSAEDRDTLESFLQLGTIGGHSLRISVAEYLASRGFREVGLPLLVQNGSSQLINATSAEVEAIFRAIVAYGAADLETMFTNLFRDRAWEAEDQKAVTVLLTQGTNLDTRYWARDRIWTSTQQTVNFGRLARTFAWGVQLGYTLTGHRFKIEMLTNDADLGYTRLRENRLFITPMPILRGERGGMIVVRGLIVHEYGHHIYHKGEGAEAVWQQADTEKLGRLLNLVADEHLERNLRQRSARFGDLLKVLAAYAFQYSARELPVAALLRYLGPRAAAVLPQVTLAAARKPGHVVVGTGRLLFEMEAAGHSFARFVRALRMGLGNRTGDPRVAEALTLFRSSFRRSTMPQLLDVARRLREIFGDEADMLDHFAQEDVLAGDEAEWLANSPGITPDELRRQVDGLIPPPGSDSSKPPRPGNVPAAWGLNLRPEETFSLIADVVKLAHDPVSHAVYARQVARPSRQLRRYFQDLGVSLKPQRARIQGRMVDRTRIRDFILKGDPRLLIARNVARATDLFLGVAIDCSGSMFGPNLEKAKLFGTMLAEALKGLRDVDLRLFGFTDRTIFDAGNARRCAVHGLTALDGNNDAAALWHVFRVARASRRRAKLLVMISDGLPTQCTVASLKALVARLTRWNYCCAQVAVQPLEQICFPHYILLDDQQLDASVRKFGEVVVRLVGQALGMA
jgi:hypothetical protein